MILDQVEKNELIQNRIFVYMEMHEVSKTYSWGVQFVILKASLLQEIWK